MDEVETNVWMLIDVFVGRKHGMIIKTLNDMLSEQLKNEDFRKEYKAVQPEMDVIRAIVDVHGFDKMTL